MKRNYIDETVRQWLIWSITQSDVAAPAFYPTQNDVQLLAIDQILHCTKWDASINSFHHIEFQPVSWVFGTCFAETFVCHRRADEQVGRFCLWRVWGGDGEEEEKEMKCANPACEFVLIPDTDRTECLHACAHLFHTSSCMSLSDMLTFCTAHCLFFIDNQVNN